MPIRVIASHAGEIELSADLPSSLSPLRVPESICYGASGSFGHLLCQQMDGEHISIQYIHIYFSEEDEMHYSSAEPALRLQIALRNSFYHDAGGLGEWVLHERGFNLNYVPTVTHKLQVQKRESYTSFSIYYKSEQLKPLQNSFPGLAEFLKKVHSGEAAQLNTSYCIADGPMALMIDSILNCRYTGSLKKIYLDNVAMEILVLALVKIAGKKSITPATMSRSLVGKVYKAKELMLGDMGKSLSMAHLADRTGLSPYKLNNGFKAIYGMGVAHWLLETRMERAHVMLLDGDETVSIIAQKSGYSHPNAFSLAFKKYFGYTPAFVQKHGKPFAGLPNKET